jgi:hypothetical protein
MAGLAAVFDQEAPLEHDVLGDRQRALFEHRPHLVREPVIELRAAVGVGNKFNAEPDFGEGRRADVEQVERLRGDKAWREGRLEHDAMKLNHLRHCEEHSDEAIQENVGRRLWIASLRSQ